MSWHNKKAARWMHPIPASPHASRCRAEVSLSSSAKATVKLRGAVVASSIAVIESSLVL
jgi:hypothetical protein